MAKEIVKTKWQKKTVKKLEALRDKLNGNTKPNTNKDKEHSR